MALRVNEYLIIETWNGEGYSYKNDASILKTEDTAKRIAENSVAKILKEVNLSVNLTLTSIDLINLIEYCSVEDSGSIMILPYLKQYGVMIKCEINEYTIFNTKEEYDNAYKEAVELADPKDYQLGDMFIHAHKDDYSRQFKILKP